MKSGMLCVTLMAVLLAGCASPVGDSQFTSSATSTGEEDNRRVRARVHTELAAGYFDITNYAVALEEVNEALRADPNYGPAFNVAGLIYAALREDRLAEQNFERAVRINPTDSDANNNFGLFLCQRKRWKEGLRYFEAALKNPLYQTPERSFINAGLCSRSMQDIASAEAFFTKALSVRPNLPQALFQMADIAHLRGDQDLAKKYILQVMQGVKPNPEVLWLALRISRRQGDRASEASYAAQLRRQFPDSKEVRALTAGQYE